MKILKLMNEEIIYNESRLQRLEIQSDKADAKLDDIKSIARSKGWVVRHGRGSTDKPIDSYLTKERYTEWNKILEADYKRVDKISLIRARNLDLKLAIKIINSVTPKDNKARKGK